MALIFLITINYLIRLLTRQFYSPSNKNNNKLV